MFAQCLGQVRQLCKDVSGLGKEVRTSIATELEAGFCCTDMSSLLGLCQKLCPEGCLHSHVHPKHFAVLGQYEMLRLIHWLQKLRGSIRGVILALEM